MESWKKSGYSTSPAPVNPISGDFSIKASGFYIEGGKIIRPANLLVISGNFINMMNNVIEVGSDIEINGNDLKRFGIAQGKIYKEIFEYVLAQKFLDNKISKDDEINLVKEKFL